MLAVIYGKIIIVYSLTGGVSLMPTEASGVGPKGGVKIIFTKHLTL